MKKRSKGIKIFKWLTIVFSVFVAALFITWLLLPKYAIDYIEEHDREWIDRDITIEELSINFFNFSIAAKGVVITEPNFKNTFVSFDHLLANFESWPLLKI